MFWLVVITSMKTITLHSFHKTEETAQQWARCKEHDGESVVIVEVSKVTAQDLQTFLEDINPG